MAFNRMEEKRCMYLTEEILEQHPNICAHKAPSLDDRQAMVVTEAPKLGRDADVRAIKDWGQPKSRITHLIFCTTSGVDMPGADYQLTQLLGLHPSVGRFMLYQQGCFGGGTVLRLAKALAENHRGARVLVVCSEITAVTFRGPSEDHLDNLVGQALFGDGAAALVVGADPDTTVERPIFEIVSASQTILPDSDGAMDLHLTEAGLTFHLRKDVPEIISKNIENSLTWALRPLGISDWNSVFWIVHPGGPAILDQVEAKWLSNPPSSAPRGTCSASSGTWPARACSSYWTRCGDGRRRRGVRPPARGSSGVCSLGLGRASRWRRWSSTVRLSDLMAATS